MSISYDGNHYHIYIFIYSNYNLILRIDAEISKAALIFERVALL